MMDSYLKFYLKTVLKQEKQPLESVKTLLHSVKRKWTSRADGTEMPEGGGY